MALILNIETSTTVCSVCLADDGVALAHAEGTEGNEHAGKLTLFIDEIMSAAKIAYARLDAVSVSAGPGSYTGLRIGASVAKGLCYALGKPLLAVPTLMALAENIKASAPFAGAVYVPVMDARRMDIYTALYDAAGNELRPAAMVTINNELKTGLAQFPTIVIGGNAIQKFREAAPGDNFRFVENISCDSRSMIMISEKKYRSDVFEDTGWFQPFYLQEFQPKLPLR